MGTRSLTHIIRKEGDIEETLTTIYIQYDGYPEGVGVDIASHLSKRKLVTGFGSDKMVYNGIGCLATQIIKHLKGDGPGNVYLYPPNSKGYGEEFVYKIIVNENTGEIVFECVGEFKGSAADFLNKYQ